MFIPSAALKAGVRNSRRSTSGCSSRRWRRTKVIPTAAPSRIDATAVVPSPSSAISLTP